MEPTLVGLAGLLLFLLLLVLGQRIGVAFIVSGFLGILYLAGPRPALSALGLTPFSLFSNYVLMAIPLFVFMGFLAFHAGIAGELFDAANKWLGRLPGGMAIATTVAAGGFAACTGSSTAAAGALGAVALPEMRRLGYAPGLAAGCCAAGGTLGILIPPSLGFIVYGAMTEASVGKLFLAGYLPGLLAILSYSIVIIVSCRLKRGLAPQGQAFSWGERFSSLKGTWGMLLLMLLVMGGIFVGIFTATEAGAVGALGALLIVLGRRRLSKKTLVHCLIETSVTSSLIFFIFAGGTIFSLFVAMSGVGIALGELILASGLSMYGSLIAMLIIYLILGCFMDSMSMLVLTLPLFLVTLQAFDVNLIWFGVLVVRMIEIGLLTPPVGMNVYTIQGMAPDISLGEVFKGIIPFVVADIVVVAILLAFPQISLFLPNLMMRK